MHLMRRAYGNKDIGHDNGYLWKKLTCSFLNLTGRLICLFIISAAVLAVPANGWSNDGIAAITAPSADVTLSFIQPGRIADVHVMEGDMVKAGQVLIEQDDKAEQAQLLLLQEQSRDTTQIESRKASLAQKKVYLKRLEWAASRGSATEMEIEESKLDVKIAEFSLKTAEFEHEQSKRKYREAKIRVDNMTLKSPIEGRVEKVDVEVGESIDGLTSAARIVRTDPLWIDVHVPFETGRTITLDQTAEIIFPGNEQTPSKGKIIFISTVADAASATLSTRIEVPNKLKRPAGEHISVLFPTPLNEGERNYTENAIGQ